MREPTLVRWLLVGEWRAHPTRIVVGAVAIAVGVALAFAVHVVNQSALDAFSRAVRTVKGAADLHIQATTAEGFDESLYPRVARLPGIAQASPVVERTVNVNGVRLTVLGLDVFRAAGVTPSLMAHPLPGHPFPRDSAASGDGRLGDRALFLSAAALAALGHPVGDTVTLASAGQSDGGGASDFVIAGTVPGAGDSDLIGIVDIAAAQWRLGSLGRLQRIDVRLVANTERASIEKSLRAVLPPDALLASEATDASRSDSLSRAYRVNLEMLAMVALLTGGFLVYSAQSLSVARRQTHFALLRVLGLRRRALLAQIAVEGVILGVLGGVAGIAGGFLIAKLALTLLGGDLGGGYFRAMRPSLVFPPGAAALLCGLGVLVALIGSLVPGLEGQRVQPAVALKKTGLAQDPRQQRFGWPGPVLLLAGGLIALAPPVDGLPLFGYAAIALILAGGVASMASLARLLLDPVQRLDRLNPVLDLAAKRLWGAPDQASIALCGIVASTSLAIAMAVMVSSFRGSVVDWLEQITPADLYLRIDNGGAAALSPGLQHKLAAVPGVAAIEFRRMIPLLLRSERPAVALIARPVNPAGSDHTLPLIGRPVAVPGGMTAAWISEPLEWLYDVHPGDRLALPLGGTQSSDVFVAGVWRDYSRQFGAIVISDADYTRLTGDASRSEAAITLAAGASPTTVAGLVRDQLPDDLAAQADIGAPGDIRAAALKIFDHSFAVTYALEAIAILVGLTGVAATLSAQTLARAKEFGMLRHIGVRRRQILLMLATEGALLGVVGMIAGIGLGLAMSQVLIHVVNPQSFHWTMETRLPINLVVFLALAMVAASALTAVIAGRTALSTDAVRAVREDW